MGRQNGILTGSYEHAVITVSGAQTNKKISELSTALFSGSTSPMVGTPKHRSVTRIKVSADTDVKLGSLSNPAITIKPADGTVEFLDLTISEIFVTTANGTIITVSLFY